MSIESSVEDRSVGIGENNIGLYGNAAPSELVAFITTMDVTMSPNKMRMEYTRKVVRFQSCITELMKLTDRYDGTVVD